MQLNLFLKPEVSLGLAVLQKEAAVRARWMTLVKMRTLILDPALQVSDDQSTACCVLSCRGVL